MSVHRIELRSLKFFEPGRLFFQSFMQRIYVVNKSSVGRLISLVCFELSVTSSIGYAGQHCKCKSAILKDDLIYSFDDVAQFVLRLESAFFSMFRAVVVAVAVVVVTVVFTVVVGKLTNLQEMFVRWRNL